MAKDKKKKSNVLSLDFEGVEGRVLLPEGDYRVHFAEASREDGNEHDYIRWTFVVKEGQFEDKKCYTNTSLAPQALWNLRNLLEAAGVDVPDGSMDLDLDNVEDLGEDFMVTIVHEDYEDRKTMKVVEYFPMSDEATATTKGNKEKLSAKAETTKPGKKEAAPEPEPEEVDFDNMDADELEKFVDEHDLDVDVDDFKKLKEKRAAVEEAWSKAQEAGGGEGASADYDEDAINEMGTKELQAIIDKAKLDVELEGSTKTKRRAVIKALKKAKLLD
jgi:hypothetical protein